MNMLLEEQARKLKWIADLTAEELVGWEWFATKRRTPFPGELAALMARKQALGVA